MGQYFLFVILNEDGKTIQYALNPHRLWQGAKIKEHSYVGNRFTNWAEALLTPEGSYHKSRIVWAGDYAEPIENGKNLYNQAIEKIEEFEKQDDNLLMPETLGEYKYIVNHSKKQYIQLIKNYEDTEVHPLPFLTAIGEGYNGEWAGDIISMEKEKPDEFTEYIYKK